MKNKGQIGIIFYLSAMIFIILLNAQAFNLDYEIIMPLRAPEPQENANFGQSLALGEELLVIGESNGDIEEILNAGKVYIFDHDGNLLRILQAQMPELHAYFGLSVAVNNDIVLIGEPFADESDAGRVYIFDHEGNLLKTLKAPEPQDYGNFGWSVAVSEDMLVVGEPGADTEGMFSAGRAYVFDYDGNLLKTLQAQEPQIGAEFGKSITINAEEIFIGEPSATVDGIYGAGRVTVFDLDGNVLGIIQSQYPQYGGAFGTSLSVNKDIVAIGEEKADIGGIIFAGKTHIIQLIKEDRATFILSDLIINPISVEVGEIVTIQVNVTNRGGRDGTYNVTLKINSIKEDEKTVFLNPNETEIVNFKILTTQPGIYNVKVNNLSDSYSVNESTKDKNYFRDIPGFPLESIALGTICVVFMFWLFYYKKR